MDNRIKLKIVQEATKYFMLYGIKSTSMDMVATALHISKKTLYEIFPCKDELLRNCVFFVLEKTKEKIADVERYSDSSLEVIWGINDLLLQEVISFCPAFYKDIKNFQDIMNAVYNELKVFIYDTLLIACNRAVKEAHIIQDYNFEFLFSFFENSLYAFYLSRNTPPESQVKVFRYTIQIYLTGICTDKGRDCLREILSYKKNKTIIN